MEDQGRHGMVAQQAAAKAYEPVFEGPPVGDKTSIDAITHEYAKADPVYVEKTLTLPQTYTHYRPIRGDGNCGWRAIGFAYFEKLIEMGDQARIEGEAARLTSFHSVMASIGGYDYVDDFADEAIGLLRDVATLIADPRAALACAYARWNSQESGLAIIYYLRLLTATWLKMNEASYSAFIPGEMGIQSYCGQSIELPDREIEHIGVDALASVLLKPIDVVLEVAYLDRTAGSQVNRYRVPGEATDQDADSLGPLIYLLFRPDHYDILYRDAPPIIPTVVNLPQGDVTMQVNRVNGYTHNAAIASTQAGMDGFSPVDFDTISMLPAFGPAVSGMGSLSSTSIVSGSDTDSWMGNASWTAPVSYPRSVCTPQPGQGGLVQTQPTMQPRKQPQQQQQQQQQHMRPTLITSSSSASTLLSPNGSMMGSPAVLRETGLTSQSPAPSSPFRFSPVQLEYDGTKVKTTETTFQVTTATFKNSVYNRAHYGNPSFHPEEWRPQTQSPEGRCSNKRKGRKDSS